MCCHGSGPPAIPSKIVVFHLQQETDLFPPKHCFHVNISEECGSACTFLCLFYFCGSKQSLVFYFADSSRRKSMGGPVVSGGFVYLFLFFFLIL